ncbi:hypothetical protein AB0M87_11285 [Streptomyces sp. NPDC051320]|uniref:hypothetical protein n=1 Tax=Streptomyces sp. NPDC051320 TaxID=3154644 RepID=UPI0034392B65
MLLNLAGRGARFLELVRKVSSHGGEVCKSATFLEVPGHTPCNYVHGDFGPSIRVLNGVVVQKPACDAPALFVVKIAHPRDHGPSGGRTENVSARAGTAPWSKNKHQARPR